MNRRALLALLPALTLCAWSVFAAIASATLPDGRGYELVSPVAKNGLSPYAAVPSTDGAAVDYQARGAFGGAPTGALNLYQARRTAGGWATTSLTPTPTQPLGPLELQAPVWLSDDLTKSIFTTPSSYAPADEDAGALSLYLTEANGTPELLSRGTQGGIEPRHATFDAATPDGKNIVFSSAASLLPDATGLSSEVSPEPEYLYQRDVSSGTTNLLSLDGNGQAASFGSTTLAAPYFRGGIGELIVARADGFDGFLPGQTVTIGVGLLAEKVQVRNVRRVGPATESIVLTGGALHNDHPVGTPVFHQAEGAILGDGAHLAAGAPPAGEYVPADNGSGSTTNAISADGSKVFFEAPSSAGPDPASLYMRADNSTTVKIAGGEVDGSEISGSFAEEIATFGSARYEGAAADGSLAFFTSNEGLAGAANSSELYEFNTTNHAIGVASPLSVAPVSAGLNGDRNAASTTAQPVGFDATAIEVVSTAGFVAGETIAFAPFHTALGPETELTDVIASVANGTELTFTHPLRGFGQGTVPVGTGVHGLHPASMTAVSSDGSRVYFISDGILANNSNAEQATAVPVKPNLYRFDTATGETTFIATVAESDVKTAAGGPTGLAAEPDISRPAVPTPNGNVLVFASAANLTGQNPWQQYTEIYRYSVAGNTLQCLSCTAPGVKPTGNATFGETAGGTYDPPGLTSPISQDGSRVFFQTPDSLVPEDQNGGAPLSAKFETPTDTDVYEAEGGKVSLISSGKATTPTVLMGTTPSGNDVLFTTTAVLAPQDTDGGYENVWDARVGGGFPADEGAGAPSCSGSTCRAAFGPAPVFAPPTSTSPQPGGNVSSVSTAVVPAAKPPTKPKTLTCRKGSVKKRVKGKLVCVKKKKGSATRAAHKASRSESRRSR